MLGLLLEGGTMAEESTNPKPEILNLEVESGLGLGFRVWGLVFGV